MEHINREDLEEAKAKEVKVHLMASTEAAVIEYHRHGQELKLALAGKKEDPTLARILAKEGQLGVDPEVLPSDRAGIPSWFARIWETSLIRPKLFNLAEHWGEVIMDPKTFGAFHLFLELSGDDTPVELARVDATPEAVVEEFTEELFGFMGSVQVHPAVYKTVGKIASRFYDLPWEVEEAMGCVFSPGCSFDTLEFFLKKLREVNEHNKGEITAFLAEGAILFFFAEKEPLDPENPAGSPYVVHKESIRQYMAELFELDGAA